MRRARSEAATDVGVDVQIAVDYGTPVQQVADRVRNRITQHIATQTGLTTTEVNVTVVDVRLRPDDPRLTDGGQVPTQGPE